MNERSSTWWQEAAAGLLALFLLTGRWSLDRVLDSDLGTFGEPRLYIVGIFALIVFSPAHRAPTRFAIDDRGLVVLGGMAVFFVYAVSSTMWTAAYEPGEVAFEMMLLGAVVGTTARLCALVGPAAVSRSLWRWLAIVLTLFAVGAISSGAGANERLAVLGGGPNVFGRNMAVLATGLLAQMLAGRQRLWVLPIVALAALLMVLTGSRGAFVAASGALALLAWHGRHRMGRTVWLAIGMALAIGIALSTEVGGRAFEVFVDRIFRLGMQQRYDAGRSEIYAEAIRIGWHYPVLGAGASAFAVLGNSVYPHNIFLELFCEYGLVAPLALLPMFVAALRAAVGRAGEGRAEDAVAFMVALVSAQFSGSLYDSRGVFVFATLLCLHAAHDRREPTAD